MKTLNPFGNKIIFLMCLVVMLLGSCKSKQGAASTSSGSGGVFHKKMLTAVAITSVDIVSWPLYGRDNEKWDAYAPMSTDPDLYIQIKWNGSLLYQSETRDDVVLGNPVKMTTGLPIQLKPFDQPVTIEIFDEDGVSHDDNVGYFTVTFPDYQKQDVVELRQGDLVLKLGVQWTFE